MRIDAHHHLWDLSAVHYPWLMAKGVERFFGDPAPIQRNYLLDEFRRDAAGFDGSVHIQVGAEDGWDEAAWIQAVAEANPDWPMVQVAFCDLTADDLSAQLDRLQTLSTLRGVRQIVGRAPSEDAQSGTNALLGDPRFAAGLREVGRRGLSFDLQLIPDLYDSMARVLEAAPDTPIALCHAGSPIDRSAEGLRDWAERLRVLSALPQITCKLSGLGMFDHNWTPDSIHPIVDTLLDQFGPDCVMFGSNFPVDSLYSNYSDLRSAFQKLVPSAMHAAVFGGTAKRFYSF
ncbi:amidohydrolase family protein [Primorskyibacter aestuariivivens]|uniref:amidohydrolase family protein n=1 Tax=Primorskyibacter aestuariivivens TaxID=1888912 RepID=UPI002300297E|nr:amidohydrolase family protein [Primorskyibacter aestuariivivens]MDA7426851.1 amidohydrolase family protein [Primorskyibacter aestuariivivens]